MRLLLVVALLQHKTWLRLMDQMGRQQLGFSGPTGTQDSETWESLNPCDVPSALAQRSPRETALEAQERRGFVCDWRAGDRLRAAVGTLGTGRGLVWLPQMGTGVACLGRGKGKSTSGDPSRLYKSLKRLERLLTVLTPPSLLTSTRAFSLFPLSHPLSTFLTLSQLSSPLLSLSHLYSAFLTSSQPSSLRLPFVSEPLAAAILGAVTHPRRWLVSRAVPPGTEREAQATPRDVGTM